MIIKALDECDSKYDRFLLFSDSKANLLDPLFAKITNSWAIRRLSCFELKLILVLHSTRSQIDLLRQTLCFFILVSTSSSHRVQLYILKLWQLRCEEETSGRCVFRILTKISERRAWTSSLINWAITEHGLFPSTIDTSESNHSLIREHFARP